MGGTTCTAEYCRRTEPQQTVELDGKVIRRGAEYPTTVTNLSLDGCGLLGHFAIAEKVEVRIGKLGLFAAQVRWAFNGRAGVKFTNRSDARRSDEGKDISADEHAAAAIEYGIIAALIALALASALAGRDGCRQQPQLCEPAISRYNASERVRSVGMKAHSISMDPAVSGGSLSPREPPFEHQTRCGMFRPSQRVQTPAAVGRRDGLEERGDGPSILVLICYVAVARATPAASRAGWPGAQFCASGRFLWSSLMLPHVRLRRSGRWRSVGEGPAAATFLFSDQISFSSEPACQRSLERRPAHRQPPLSSPRSSTLTRKFISSWKVGNPI